MSFAAITKKQAHKCPLCGVKAVVLRDSGHWYCNACWRLWEPAQWGAALVERMKLGLVVGPLPKRVEAELFPLVKGESK